MFSEFLSIHLYGLLAAHLLHFLTNLGVDIDKLGNTTIDTDSLALTQISLVIVGGNTLFMTGISDSKHVQILRCEIHVEYDH